ncbi:MAG: phosphatase PAP2 family protein [Phocaeicola sp.]
MRTKKFLFTLLSLFFCHTGFAAQADSVQYLVSPSSVFSKKESAPSSFDKPFSVKRSFNENFTWMGVGFVSAGLIVKINKEEFRSVRNHFQPDFRQKYDDYTQYAPALATYVLKLSGVENRSSWTRLLVSNAFSYAAMAAVVNTMKYSINELRPDGTSSNSFPSGHTATSFVSATILHKEYGAKSPWYSVAAYTVATATGVTRILNNRHWISDVLVGAGIGILSADLGYFLGDLIFKDKGIKRFKRDLNAVDISTNPSFISLGVQVGMGPNKLNAPDIYDNYNVDLTPASDAHALNMKLRLGTSSSLNVEGAYFFHKNFGVGGRIRATATPVIAESNADDGFNYVIDGEPLDPDFSFVGLESSHLGMFDFSFGGYYSYPINRRMALGTKLLIGNRLTSRYKISSFYDVKIDDGEIERSKDEDFMEIDSENSLVFGTGVSLTYAYRYGMAFRLNVDYDYSSPEYVYRLYNRFEGLNVVEDVFKRKTSMNSFNVGLAMTINF